MRTIYVFYECDGIERLLWEVYNSFFFETHIVELLKLLKEMPREEHAKFLEARQQSILELRLVKLLSAWCTYMS